ncbi:hypothetical protein, partial [Anaerotignum lactatifermentans]|uniref:hypothetical protein n=1 Tax=Anaerotignum lactatifermentans TaxID=160404 RepID=UPI0030799858
RGEERFLQFTGEELSKMQEPFFALFGINRLILYLHQNKKEGAPEENAFQNTGKSIFFSVFFLKIFILSRMLSFYTENIYS